MALLPVATLADAEPSQLRRPPVRVVHTPWPCWMPRRRFPLHPEAMLTAGCIEEGLRASAREMATYAREHPGSMPCCWPGRLAPFNGWPSPPRCPRWLTRELRDAGAVPPRIEVTPVPAIDRDPGHGAELKLVTTEAGSA
jgi:hypothetical protein